VHDKGGNFLIVYCVWCTVCVCELRVMMCFRWLHRGAAGGEGEVPSPRRSTVCTLHACGQEGQPCCDEGDLNTGNMITDEGCEPGTTCSNRYPDSSDEPSTCIACGALGQSVCNRANSHSISYCEHVRNRLEYHEKNVSIICWIVQNLCEFDSSSNFDADCF
jgi:hypothetical protein